MSEQIIEVRRLGSGAAGGVLLTIALHGALGYLVWASQQRERPPLDDGREVITTELVKIGKPREKFWLPKIKAPPKPTRKVDTLKIADDPNAAPTPKEAPKAEDADVSDKLRQALNRAKLLRNVEEEETDEGDLRGSLQGTASEAREGDAYMTQVRDAITANWNVPAGLISDEELDRLEAIVVISIAGSGELTAERISRPSGNQLFDDSCLQAVKITGRVPPPPASASRRFGLKCTRKPQ